MRQRYRCPEASYWNIGDVVLIGKGDNEWTYSLFDVVDRISANVVVLDNYRPEGGN